MSPCIEFAWRASRDRPRPARARGATRSSDLHPEQASHQPRRRCGWSVAAKCAWARGPLANEPHAATGGGREEHAAIIDRRRTIGRSSRAPGSYTQPLTFFQRVFSFCSSSSWAHVEAPAGSSRTTSSHVFEKVSLRLGSGGSPLRSTRLAPRYSDLHGLTDLVVAEKRLTEAEMSSVAARADSVC